VEWSEQHFAMVTKRSQQVHGNKLVLPVAVAIAALDRPRYKVPELSQALEGRIPHHRIHEALQRLCAMGVLVEMPYPGRPAPRIFEVRSDPFWIYARSFVPSGKSGERV
jgi:hypothetical protein